MQCEMVMCAKGDDPGFVRCTKTATHTCWCPTWISAEEGPMELCEEHTHNFRPEFNKHAKDGNFYWGEEAVAQYEKAIPPEKRKRKIITCPDEN